MDVLSCFLVFSFFTNASPLVESCWYSGQHSGCWLVGEGAGGSGHLKEEWRLEPQLFPHPTVSALPPVTCPHIHQSKTIFILPGLFSLFKSFRSPYVLPASVISLGLIPGRKPASEAFWVQKSDSSYFFIEQGTTPRGAVWGRIVLIHKTWMEQSLPLLCLWLGGHQRGCPERGRIPAPEPPWPQWWWSTSRRRKR